MKGIGLLFHFLLLLIIFVISQANFYAIVAFTQGALSRVEILAQNSAYEFGTQGSVTIPEKIHVLFTPCSDIVLPSTRIFEYMDIVDEINAWCGEQLAIVCFMYEYHTEDFYMSCKGLTRDLDKTYYFPAEASTRQVLIEDINETTVKLNIP